VGEWTVRVEEKRAIGERKLESGIRSELGSTSIPGFVVGLVGVVRMIRLAGVVRTRPVGVVMVGFVRIVGLVGMVRVVRMFGSIGTTRFAMIVMVSLLARRANPLRLGPLGVLIAL